MRIISLITLFAALTWFGCRTDEGTTSNRNASTPPPVGTALSDYPGEVLDPTPIQPVGSVDENFEPCNRYYPLVPGSLAVYALTYSTGLSADARVVVESAAKDGRAIFKETTQIVDSSGGAYKLDRTVRMLECKDGNIVMLSEEGYNKVEALENRKETKLDGEAVLMVAPSSLRPGASWSYRFTPILQRPREPAMTLDLINTSFKVEGQEDVTVAAGKFRGYKISRRMMGKDSVEHYVPGLGLVMRTSAEGPAWNLKEYSGLAPLD